MKGIKRDTRKKLLDLIDEHDKDTKKERMEKLASDLQITPEFAQKLFDDKEIIDDELAQRIEEQLDKYKNEDEDNIDFDKKRLQRAFRKRIAPGTGKRIDALWDEKFKNQNKEIVVGDEIYNKIENYGELKFYKKVLTPRDFNNSIYELQDIPNIPKLGEQVIVIDCNNGEEYPTRIQESQHSISTGLKSIWDKFNRRKRLKPGDIIGIALDPNSNHRIYIDFEYKERDNKQKKEQCQEDIKNNTKKYEKYAIAIEKSIPWIKEQIANSKDGKIRMKTKDLRKEMGPDFENRNQTSIYWGLKFVLPNYGITVEQGVHQESGDTVLIMRSRTEKDELISSQKYIDGEVLQLPNLKDKEDHLEESKILKEPQKNVRSTEYDPEKEIELSQEERRYIPRNIRGAVRDSSFRYRILNVYNDRCAICGLQMNMVEACHIIPIENGGTDEIINGIALCHNHHKAFDSGLIWINEEYNIMLNHSKIEDIKGTNVAGGLDDFIKNSRIGDKIFLPDNHKFYPDIDCLTKKRYIV